MDCLVRPNQPDPLRKAVVRRMPDPDCLSLCEHGEASRCTPEHDCCKIRASQANAACDLAML